MTNDIDNYGHPYSNEELTIFGKDPQDQWKRLHERGKSMIKAMISEMIFSFSKENERLLDKDYFSRDLQVKDDLFVNKAMDKKITELLRSLVSKKMFDRPFEIVLNSVMDFSHSFSNEETREAWVAEAFALRMVDTKHHMDCYKKGDEKSRGVLERRGYVKRGN